MVQQVEEEHVQHWVSLIQYSRQARLSPTRQEHQEEHCLLEIKASYQRLKVISGSIFDDSIDVGLDMT